jgi:uncharacterized protein DUF4838
MKPSPPILLTLGMALLVNAPVLSETFEISVVADGEPNATIVVAERATPAANLAALELQYHIERMTGAILPVRTDAENVEGTCFLVGESRATRHLGLRSEDFESQEYLIRFLPEMVVLIGRDWIDTAENRGEAGRGTNWQSELSDWRQEIDYDEAVGRLPRQDAGKRMITLPGIFDDQGTCYATYDFLERFCDIRWYGPTELNVVYPHRSGLTVAGDEVRRAPAMKYREGMGGGRICQAQWNKPNASQLNLYWRRLRVGGEKWAGNHSFMSFQDRFQRENPENPDLFEEERPDYFAQGREGEPGERQLCYTNPALVRQVAQDARDYFDGNGLEGFQVAMGEYFAVIPLDNDRWCTCDNCQRLLARDHDNIKGRHFSSGTATHYLFGFVNAVAREVAKTHPDKYISTLAYHVYAYPPEDFELEPNVAVAPCLQVRNYWAPKIKQNDLDFYKKWVNQEGRRVYLWNYYCFPMEPAAIQGWHCFPGFSAHALADQILMYHQDGVRGVFLCGIGEQVDYYLTMKMYDDPSIDPDVLLDEFFDRYFGAASKPMKQFYLLIEETFSNPDNYPAEVRTRDRQYHQNERIAWKYLGTETRMTRLRTLMEKAQARAGTDLEQRRVQTWKEGVWDYMVEGREKYLARPATE